ncbi:hypothetical protein C5E16_14350 [Clavibacter michiganensis]|uniref:Uncharacterized protein n=1 Tax=Clavibacter michiganensis TaxID=28447 RepID=A0A2S5VNZ0_9MICO|nr:hypothetical protein C5E16_14350 [Clavibacter michiganensis]
MKVSPSQSASLAYASICLSAPNSQVTFPLSAAATICLASSRPVPSIWVGLAPAGIGPACAADPPVFPVTDETAMIGPMTMMPSSRSTAKTAMPLTSTAPPTTRLAAARTATRARSRLSMAMSYTWP